MTRVTRRDDARLGFEGDELEHDRGLQILLVDDAILIEVCEEARRIRWASEHRYDGGEVSR